MPATSLEYQLRAALLGLAVGDALGVPVEFQSRAARRLDPVVTMRAYGTHHQPAGTWSDDASLTFCLAEAMADGFTVGRSGRVLPPLVLRKLLDAPRLRVRHRHHHPRGPEPFAGR